MPEPQSDLARETLKDPYNFDFLTLTEKHNEKELENALINHVAKFLLELGAGFSYIGQQYKLEVSGENIKMNLSFEMSEKGQAQGLAPTDKMPPIGQPQGLAPTGLPRRRSIRLKGYDYSQSGLYFITICTQN